MDIKIDKEEEMYCPFHSKVVTAKMASGYGGAFTGHPGGQAYPTSPQEYSYFFKVPCSPKCMAYVTEGDGKGTCKLMARQNYMPAG